MVESPRTRRFARRDVLRLAGAGLGAAALSWRAPALAATPPHTFKHGAFEITVVSDGHLVIPAAVAAPDAPPAERNALLATIGHGPEQMTPATNITLIRSGSETILIDTGSGANFQPTAGKLAENLEAAGIKAETITWVVFSHAHPDHMWGTIDDFNELRFPNASYAISETEWNFWTAPDVLSKMPEAMHPFVVGAQRNLAAIKEKVKTVKAGEEIVTGVRALDTAGHTPGHIAIEIAGGDGLIVTADSVPHSAVTFAHPEWRFGFDAIPELAIASRKKLLDRAASEKTRLIGYHWPYPGVGHAERRNGAYRFVAAG
jgi:glyoxylase-like metal-dependent hydrolase (beta-lactamase superfamily II)